MVDVSENGLGDALRVVEKLAKAADGKLTPVSISNEAKMTGVPAHVPAFIREGQIIGFESVKRLLEEYRFAPERRAGVATVRTLRSFIELTRRHQDEHSALFSNTDWPGPSLTAVIDYHGTDHVARFGKHRVHYPFPLTVEFDRWIKHNGKSFNQIEFAEFVENNIMDLSVPLDSERVEFEALFRAKFAVPTDLIALARGLEVNVESKIKNAIKLESGEAELRFETEHRDAAGAALHVPGLFMLSCRAFVDGSEVRLPARLRYRVNKNDGSVAWSYQLFKWEDALRARVAADLALAAKETGLPAFEGKTEE